MKLTRPLVFIDAETAGDANSVDPQKDRIVSFAAVKFPDNQDRLTENFSFVCNPGIPIAAERSAVHGFTDESVKDKPPVMRFLPETLRFIAGCDLAGFNLLNYDVPLLWEECHRNGFTLDLKGVHIIDAGNIFKKKQPRDLTAAVGFYCEHEHEGAHGALSDCLATAEVLEAQIDLYEDLANLSTAELAKLSQMDDRVDLAGVIVRNKDGEAVFNTKRNRGVRVIDDFGYANWMLRSDFSDETKARIQEILSSPQPDPAYSSQSGSLF